ncbi:MAG TPA: methionine--tRNA ligase [Bellilinea sp.]|mgnify:CR=1 FL=1|nr:methionine--tRNA ligase [Bellilinea sp.]
MSNSTLVCIAWPYANAEIHVGNVTGSHLPGDIFARYQRMKGRQVAMVSGSDSHGTPITIRADAEKLTAEEVYKKYHQTFLDLFESLGITYDLYTSTHTENHFNVSQSMFKALLENGYLYKEKQLQWFSTSQNRFLPDRYVEGTCYICGYTNARSDQCDKCGSLLEPNLLIEPRSRIDGSTPELKETEHFFLDLGKLQPEVEKYLSEREEHFRPNVLRQSKGQLAGDGLHGRPITRDLDWGVPVPLEGQKGKCLYVWFEAVIGYLSATIELAKLNGENQAWDAYWHDPEAKIYNFIGKDNIPFHAIIWPAELVGAGTKFDELYDSDTIAPLTLPYDIPANEFMNLEGQKISGSRNWAVWAADFLTRYDPDPLRYYLTVNMPETRDTDWDWEDFFKRNNDELVATWGNLANRVLSFAYKHWEGSVPEPGPFTDLDTEMFNTIQNGFETVGAELDKVNLRAALAEGMRLATEVNRYLDVTAPWTAIKTDRTTAARSIYVALNAINNLKILLAPFLPFTSQKLHRYLGFDSQLFGEPYRQIVADNLGEHEVLRYDGSNAVARWEPVILAPGHRFNKPEPLFKKLDSSIIEEERARLG